VEQTVGLSQSLFALIKEGNSEAARAFITEHKNDLDINYKEYECVTALMWAAYHKMSDICEQLIKLKADIDQKDGNGKTALNFAEDHQLTSVIELLKKVEKQRK
jgi:ankyrin repeat protein